MVIWDGLWNDDVSGSQLICSRFSFFSPKKVLIRQSAAAATRYSGTGTV